MAGKKQNDPVDIQFSVGEMSLSEAITDGTRLDELRAIRRLLVDHMEHGETLARDLAALTRQMREISKEIETLEVLERETQKEKGSDDGGSSDSARGEVWKLEAI